MEDHQDVQLVEELLPKISTDVDCRRYGLSRRVDLIVGMFNGYQVGRLDGNDTNYANDEEEILLGPGDLICVAPGIYEYKQI